MRAQSDLLLFCSASQSGPFRRSENARGCTRAALGLEKSSQIFLDLSRGGFESPVSTEETDAMLF
jgi:hypothetical protein